MAVCPSASCLFSQEIVGICKSAPYHLLALNRAMYSQSQLLELDWLRRLNLLFLLPPLLSLIMTHNASLSCGQNLAKGGNFRLLSNSSSRGARDTGWRSLFHHYSLEPLTVALPNLSSSLVTSPLPVTLSTNPRLMKLNRPFPWATPGLPCLDGIRGKGRSMSAPGVAQNKQCTNAGSEISWLRFSHSCKSIRTRM